MAKRPTTAEVTVDIRVGLGFKSYTEEVTPVQLLRSGWINDGNALRDDERVIVQVAVERVLRQQHHQRNVKVDVCSDRTWDSSSDGNGTAVVWRHGRWGLTDGEACFNAARSFEESSL